MNKSPHQWTVGRRQSNAHRGELRLIGHSRPDVDAFAGWLGSVSQLRSPAALDRAILDRVHQDFNRSPRVQPALVMSVTLCCVVFGAVVKFQPETATSPTLARSSDSPKPQILGPAASEPVRSATKEIEIRRPAIQHVPIDKPLLAAVNPLAIAPYRPKVRPALASRGTITAVRPQATPVVETVPAIRLAAVTLPRAATPIVDSQPLAARTGIEVIPVSPELGGPSVPIANALSWSSPVNAQVKLHERVNGMVSPTGLFASLPTRDSGRRPIYKRAWFVGMLGVAATGIAAGVTAAVVSAQQSAPGLASQPLKISFGPT